MRRIPWSPWRLSLAFLGGTRSEKTIRLAGELGEARKQMARHLKELGA